MNTSWVSMMEQDVGLFPLEVGSPARTLKGEEGFLIFPLVDGEYWFKATWPTTSVGLIPHDEIFLDLGHRLGFISAVGAMLAEPPEFVPPNVQAELVQRMFSLWVSNTIADVDRERLIQWAQQIRTNKTKR